jgi:hypothetical protein
MTKKLTIAQLKRELSVGRKLTMIRFLPVIWKEDSPLAREVVLNNTQHVAFKGEKIGGTGVSYLKWPLASELKPYENGFMIERIGGGLRIAYTFNN